MPRKTLTVLFAIALLAAMVTSPIAEAQRGEGGQRGDRQSRRGGGRPGGFGGGSFGGGGVTPLLLLRVDAVKNEIKVTEDQQELVEILGDELREGGPAFPENFRELSDDEQTAFREKREKWNDEQNAQAKETLKTILEDTQYKRLQEIVLQQQGVNALLDTDVATTLKITPEQTAKLKETQEASREEMGTAMREMFRGGGDGDREAAREKLENLRKASDEKMLAQLTGEQKTAFAALQGTKFEMPEDAFGFGRGGRGGRTGRGGPGGGPGRGSDRPQRPE